MAGRTTLEWGLIAGLAATLALLLGLAAFLLSRDAWVYEVEADIAAPPALVYPWITHPERRKQWQVGVIDVVTLTGRPAAEGSTRLILMAADGERWQLDETTLEADAPRLWAARQAGEGVIARLGFYLSPAQSPRATRFTYSEALAFDGVIAKLFAPVTRAERRRRAQRSLVRLEELIETAPR